jgi:hypothetical protein
MKGKLLYRGKSENYSFLYGGFWMGCWWSGKSVNM